MDRTAFGRRFSRADGRQWRKSSVLNNASNVLPLILPRELKRTRTSIENRHRNLLSLSLAAWHQESISDVLPTRHRFWKRAQQKKNERQLHVAWRYTLACNIAGSFCIDNGYEVSDDLAAQGEENPPSKTPAELTRWHILVYPRDIRSTTTLYSSLRVSNLHAQVASDLWFPTISSASKHGTANAYYQVVDISHCPL